MEKNVAVLERWASLLGGSALIAYTARRQPRLAPLSGVLALGAAALLLRGATGRCPLYRALGLSTADLGDDWARPLSGDRGGRERRFRGRWPLPEGARLAGSHEPDPVDEAAKESFPASDPPSFTPSRVG